MASTRRTAAVLVASLSFVLVALTVEVVAGSIANSPAPAWAHRLVPLAWPRWARVLWWLAVAAAALLYRRTLAVLGLRPNPVVTVLTVAPFVAFATGIALGADWATWH